MEILGFTVFCVVLPLFFVAIAWGCFDWRGGRPSNG